MEKKLQQRFLTFPKPVSLPTVLFFQNDQASSICCPFPNKLSWFRLQRPQNPALLAIPGCKLLPLLLGSHSSQESGYTSQHQEEESKTLATLFRLVLVGETRRKFCCGRKHSRQTNKWGGKARKGGTDCLFLQGHHRDASEDDPEQKSQPRGGLIKTVCPAPALVALQWRGEIPARPPPHPHPAQC